MRAVATISGITLAATATCFVAVVPASTTIRVGDNADRVNAIGQYGYEQWLFSMRGAKGSIPLKHVSFAIGPDSYHLLVRYNAKIHSLTHFRYEQRVPGAYGERHDRKDVESFTVPRPSPGPFVVGVALLVAGGYLLQRFCFIAMALYLALVLCVVLMIVKYSILAGGLAILPVLVGVG
jgi:hypothetical protein